MKNFFTMLLALTVLVGFSVNAQSRIAKQANSQNLGLKFNAQPVQEKGFVSTDYTFIPSLTNQKNKAALNEGFEGTLFPPDGWVINNGGDAGTWVRSTTTPHTGVACAAISYGSTAHDDYLVTPKLSITSGNNTLTAWIKNGNSIYPEPYDVMVSTTGTAPADFTVLVAEPSPAITWEQKIWDLSAYNDQNIYVAFRSTTIDQFRLYLDDVAGPEIFALADDAGVFSIDVPTAFAPGVITPKATVKNYGSTVQDFSVLMVINDGTSDIYTQTEDVVALAASTSLQVTFPDWTAALGSYTLMVTVINIDDMDNANDMMSQACNVLEITFGYGFNANGGTVPVGPLKINLVTGELTSIATSPNPNDFWAGADWANGVWYACQYNTNNLLSIDPITGAETIIGPLGVEFCTGIAFDIITQTMYLAGWDNTETKIYTVDLTTGAPTLVGSAGANILIGIACGSNGVLYGIDVQTDKLWEINKTTGAVTEVGALGVDISFAQDIAFDRDNNILFGTLYTSTGGLYTINTTTGAATLVSNFESEVAGFAIPYAPISYGYGFNASGGTVPKGPLKINLATGELTSIASSSGYFWAGADWANGVWYACQYFTNNLLTIDPITGVETVVGPLGVANCTGIAFDIITQKMYLSDWSGTETNIYNVNLTTGVTTLVGSAGANIIIGIACGNDGTLYGIDTQTDKFWTINKATGVATEVGALGVDISYAQDIAFDRDNNILFGTLYTSTGGLYTINTTTGVATLVSNFASEVTGFAIPYDATGAAITFNVTPNTANSIVNVNDFNYPTSNGQVTVFLRPNTFNYTVSALGYTAANGSVTVVDGVGQTIPVTLVLQVSVPTETATSISVYPNPSTGVYNIVTENAKVIVTDITGRIVLTKEIVSNGQIDLSAQPSGMYFLRIGNSNLKVVKQ